MNSLKYIITVSIFLLVTTESFAVSAELRTSTDAARWVDAGKVDGSTWANTSNYIEIFPDTKYQTVMGWGGTIQEKHWEAIKILSDAGKDSIMRELFDTSGCNITFLRCPIGCCDFDLNEAPISLNETANDYAMDHFSLARDSLRKIPLIKMAQAINPNIRFWGCPWSPPRWMHDNGQFDRGNMKNDAQTLTAYALYLEKFVLGYKEAGINIEWITCQNEPDIADGGYPKCGWTNTQERDFYKNYMIPRFKQSNLDTRILLGVFCCGTFDQWIKTQMDDATVRDFVGFTSHSYQAPDWGLRSSKDYPDIPFMQTEAPFGWPPEDVAQNWNEGRDIFNNVSDFMNNRTSVYTIWSMVNDERCQSGFDWVQMVAIKVDRNTKRVTYHPYFYAYKHFAHYVKPDAKVVRNSVNGSAPSKVNTFLNPNGDIVLVCSNAYNNQYALTVKVGNEMWKANFPPQSFNTLLIKSGTTPVQRSTPMVVETTSPALSDISTGGSMLRFTLSEVASGSREMDVSLSDLNGRILWTGHRGGITAPVGKHVFSLRSERKGLLPGMYLLSVRLKKRDGSVLTMENRLNVAH
ncbi:MAG: hypothetical protein JW863_04670 [Chitinispirillaceae bacterium]|nr:hypothetical protein [Chitinispirillaceae bacterium]